MISAGFGVDGTTRFGLADNHAFWDEIIVAAIEPSVGVITVSSMEQDEAVALAESRVWRKLTPAGVPPPPRQVCTLSLKYPQSPLRHAIPSHHRKLALLNLVALPP
jgi:hypothetical protein